MRALSDTDFLALWESGQGRHPLDRALLCLAAAFPDTPYEALADWPLGRRNRGLLDLRRRCFGDRIQSWVVCRRCCEKLEFEMDGRSLTSGPAENSSSDQFSVNGLWFRLLTSRDLALSVASGDPLQASIRIVENCLLEPDASKRWSAEELEEIGDEMAKADPLAEIRIGLKCPSCSEEWDEALDIASFFWEEVDVRARKLLFDVHSLTTAYRWTEAEILSLSDRRRAVYVSMVQA
jgi:hypothetical protein